MLIRIFASVLLLISVLFLPYWVSIILALAGMAYFPLYLEAVVLLFLSDMLFGVVEAKLFGVVYISLIISVMTILLVEFFKKQLKFYP